MSDSEEIKNRELEIISSPQKIQYLLKNYLHGKKMFIKDGESSREVVVTGFDEKNSVQLHSPLEKFKIGEEIFIFRILGRYIHLQCKILEEVSNNHYRAEVISAAIAKKDRKEIRIPVVDGEIFINHIRTSKNTIDIQRYSVPTLVKINFTNYQKELDKIYDHVVIDIFSGREGIYEAVRSTEKIFYVSNAMDPQSLKETSGKYLDLESEAGLKIENKIREYEKTRIVSEIIVPILYFTHDQCCIPIGFVQVQSRSRALTEDDVEKLKKVTEEMVERIRESNTVVVREKQQVVNFSRGGMKIAVRNKDLCKYLAHQHGFTFGLFFKGQAAITLYALIRSSYTRPDGSMILGLQVTGSSSSEIEMKRFKENVRIFEQQYKERLSPSRK